MATVMMRDRRHGSLMVAGDASGEERHGPLMVMVMLMLVVRRDMDL